MEDNPLPLPVPASGTLQSSLNGFKVTDPVQFAKTFPIDNWCTGVKYHRRGKNLTINPVYRGFYHEKHEKDKLKGKVSKGFGNQVTLKISDSGSIKIYVSEKSGWSVSGTGVKGVQVMKDMMDNLVKILNTSDKIQGFTKKCILGMSRLCRPQT